MLRRPFLGTLATALISAVLPSRATVQQENVIHETDDYIVQQHEYTEDRVDRIRWDVYRRDDSENVFSLDLARDEIRKSFIFGNELHVTIEPDRLNDDITRREVRFEFLTECRQMRITQRDGSTTCFFQRTNGRHWVWTGTDFDERDDVEVVG